MQRQTYDLMIDHVRSIYRATTGGELPEHPGAELSSVSTVDETLLRRFAELDALAHFVPQIAERVPPLGFSPPIEVIERGNEVVIQAATPGVRKEDLSV